MGPSALIAHFERSDRCPVLIQSLSATSLTRFPWLALGRSVGVRIKGITFVYILLRTSFFLYKARPQIPFTQSPNAALAMFACRNVDLWIDR